MKNDDLRRLSRQDLLEMLLEQTTRVETLESQVSELQKALQDKEIKIDQAGSIAEASLKLNGVFEAAELACRQYTENIQTLSSRQEDVCARREAESKAEAERIIQDAKNTREKMISDTKNQCAELLSAAKKESDEYWQEVSSRLTKFYDEHAGLRELLTKLVSMDEESTRK